MLTAQLAGPQFGNALDDIGSIAKQVQPYLDIVQKVLADPALPTVANQIRTISNLPSGPSTPPKPGQPVPPKAPGIGLQAVVAPIDAYIWARTHKGATLALGIAAVLAPIAAGVLIGRATKRCRAAGAAK